MTTRADSVAEPHWGAAARRATLLVVAAIFVMRAVLFGIPLDAPQVYSWVSAVLLAGCVGRSRAWIRSSVRTWVPFIILIVAYQFAYGLAGMFHKAGPDPVQGEHNVLGMPLHVSWPVRVDKFLFGGTLPTTWVQHHFHGAGRPPFAFVVTLVYFSHFFTAPVAAIVLWWRGSPLFKPWLRMVLALAGLGLTGYFLFPMAPPWFASDQGLISPEVHRYVGEGWEQLHLGIADGLLGRTTAMSNPVAAMPSLHLATATLVALVLPWRAKPLVRVLLAAYPAAMAFSLVYGGEHYVVDELVGLTLAFSIVAAWRLLARRGTRRSPGRPNEIEQEPATPLDLAATPPASS